MDRAAPGKSTATSMEEVRRRTPKLDRSAIEQDERNVTTTPTGRKARE
jgi:hypothetical protein